MPISNIKRGEVPMSQKFVGAPFVSIAFLVLIALVLATSAGSTESDAFVHPNLIVRVSWLMQHTTDPHLRLVDARPTAEYDKGHIPGAVSLPVADTFDPAQHKNYPDTKEKLEALFASRGMSNTTRIIIYDNGKEHLGARLFWTLEYVGATDVAVLNGGLKQWQAEKGEISTGQVPVEPGIFVATVDPAKLPTAAQCKLALGDPTKAILDARSPEEFRGEDVRAKYSGHIPGAVNIDWRENFTTTTVLKDPVTLKTLYESKGVTPDKEVIAHCQTGQRSSVSYWVLRLLGYPKVGNYAGSWVEWGNDPTTPKAQGS
jgi:thiosulfate/3-mercaptopyruvate sulfurtransferase